MHLKSFLILFLGIAFMPKAKTSMESACLKASSANCRDASSEGFNMAECKVACEGFLEILSKLKVLVKTNVRDSYEVMLMSSLFKTTSQKKDGFSNLLDHYSDNLWKRSKKISNYISTRGGHLTSDGLQITLRKHTTEDSFLKVLSATLDIYKHEVRNLQKVIGYSESPNDISHYEPSTRHFLLELLKESNEDVREISGHIQTLLKLETEQDSANVAQHLFDKSL